MYFYLLYKEGVIFYHYCGGKCMVISIVIGLLLHKISPISNLKSCLIVVCYFPSLRNLCVRCDFYSKFYILAL